MKELTSSIEVEESSYALFLTTPVITSRPPTDEERKERQAAPIMLTFAPFDARTQFITSRLNRENEVRAAVKQLGDEMQAAALKMLGVDERHVTFSFLVEI